MSARESKGNENEQKDLEKNGTRVGEGERTVGEDRISL